MRPRLSHQFRPSMLLKPPCSSSSLSTTTTTCGPHPIFHRAFFGAPVPGTPQRITTTRAFPYAPGSLFRLVSDIDSYHKFLPYCIDSRVTCTADALPTEADLRFAWGQFDETFKSRVVCSPEPPGGGAVEASGVENGIFELLKARWEIVRCGNGNGTDGEERGGGGGGARGCDVKLQLEFQFRNPLYAALSTAIGPKIAKAMIEAFERRAEEILEPEGEGGKGEAARGGTA